MDVVLTIAGIAGIVLGLWDMFHSLLHPSGQGRLSRLVFSGVWRISKASGHRAGSAVGPAAMVAVVLLWVLLQGLGWALIYSPHVPGGFMYSSGVNPANYPDFVEALYISFVTLATLGFGDVVATDPWIRLASPFEALTGFALLTAALTWFTQIYPPLSRRRALALELKGLADADYAVAIGGMEPAVVSRVLDGLAGQMMQVRIDFTQYTETYYFQEEDPDLSLARQLSYALALRDAATASPATEVRFSAQRLSGSLHQLGAKLAEDFVGTGKNLEEVFAAYAVEHGQNTRA